MQGCKILFQPDRFLMTIFIYEYCAFLTKTAHSLRTSPWTREIKEGTEADTESAEAWKLKS